MKIKNRNDTHRIIEEIISIIKRYTHDRSESGYDDIRGACGNPCVQCKKDERLVSILKNKLGELLEIE